MIKRMLHVRAVNGYKHTLYMRMQECIAQRFVIQGWQSAPAVQYSSADGEDRKDQGVKGAVRLRPQK